MSIVCVTPPVGPAVDVEVVKNHLGIEHSADDEIVLDLIQAATQMIEDECSIQLLQATYKLSLDEFPGHEILIKRPPVSEIVEVRYVDRSGDAKTIGDYQSDCDSSPARLLPSPGRSWPCTQAGAINAVSVTFKCGVSSTDAVPAAARKLIIALCADWYEERGTGEVRLRDQAGNLPDSPFFRRQLDHLRWI